jgi:hypothetical protein
MLNTVAPLVAERHTRRGSLDAAVGFDLIHAFVFAPR